MEVFVLVVERGGFSAAARAARLTPSAVSKLVARLENRLGARLFNRSTRALQLSPEGCAFYERASQILADIEEAEQNAKAGERPSGRLRVNTSASYATHVLAPILPDFLERYPNVALDLIQTDAVVDLLSERADVAIRTGPLQASSLIARKLGDTAKLIVGAPSYLARCGEPKTLDDLDRHHRLGFSYVRRVDGWSLMQEKVPVLVPVSGRVQASDGETLRRLAISGTGLAQLAAFTVREDIEAGRLVSVLEHLNTGDREEFFAVHVGRGGPLPSRVRAFLDYVAERGMVS
jgi:DNA-binding transcriptional LysR family regulator